MPREIEAKIPNTTFDQDIGNFVNKVASKSDFKFAKKEYKRISRSPRADYNITLLWIAAYEALIDSEWAHKNIKAEKFFRRKTNGLTWILANFERDEVQAATGGSPEPCEGSDGLDTS